jgi:hypothetical protein
MSADADISGAIKGAAVASATFVASAAVDVI